jgi:predicted dinucleotide-binding enzyme
VIGFIGGTGPEGRGLGLRFAMAGEEVLIGSRVAGRAAEAAAKVARRGGAGRVSGAVNAEVARRADPVFVTMPYEGQRAALEALREPLAGALSSVLISTIRYSVPVTAC